MADRRRLYPTEGDGKRLAKAGPGKTGKFLKNPPGHPGPLPVDKLLHRKNA